MIQRRRPKGKSIDQYFCSKCDKVSYVEFVCDCSGNTLTKEDIEAIARDGKDGRLTNKNKNKLKNYVAAKEKDNTNSSNTAV